MRVGIDEAGRGCLIGPMVVAGVALSDYSIKTLKDAGVKDSKKLTRKRREELFDKILESSEAIIVSKATPEEIDSNNLNKITYQKVIEVIDGMAWLSPNVITVDKVGPEEEVVKRIREMGFEPNVVHRADEMFTEASSASIIAKVIRDRIVDSLKREFGDFGSGYPSDRRTVQWINQVISEGRDPPNIIRRSWKFLLKHAPSFYIEKVS
ncbi:ribonuclease HII [Metallosphaera tengchongensis]|uniref:Ribonuclease HII n=1 Tax=Metallosphaera tengchongensis TaxID=1532350 RepID=A0A6N0NZD6_9CREN|nr:ribonuclease HII [Metallosphaera tengchongensis]QKR00501.1 ribonuclease HII [Metallosphaera tengchongensis]